MAVTSTNNLKLGSKGADVSELQKLLNQNGYNLDVDGNFGPKTDAATRDYQKKMGLTVDGIVGTNTWGALNKASSSGSSSSSSSSATTPAQTGAPTWNYTKSDAVAEAEALLQQQLSNKPGDYQGGTWTEMLNETLNQILNREKFSYDLNGDVLYQQYKDQFNTQGKLASMDVMGQAAAMSGGYGNSYAQTAGQQAYQSYLQQLNDKVPELYQLALNQYNQEEQALYNQAGLLAQMDEQEYGRYRDTVSDYYTDLKYLTENARYMSETEYEQALNDFNIKYGAYRDDVADQQWQTSFDEGVRQWQTSFDYQKEQDRLDREWERDKFNYQNNQAATSKDYSKKQEKAELLAASGDFSGYKELYGLTDEEVAALQNVYAAQNAPEYKDADEDDIDMLVDIYLTNGRDACISAGEKLGINPAYIDAAIARAELELYDPGA